jgi:hypothetical protein
MTTPPFPLHDGVDSTDVKDAIVRGIKRTFARTRDLQGDDVEARTEALLVLFIMDELFPGPAEAARVRERIANRSRRT